jgi:ABC-type transport system involved in multi-copper enzyme maturation permease subunit
VATSRFGLGPVFALEWLRTSRRWQLYAIRSLFVTGLLLGICFVAINTGDRYYGSSIRRQAEIGGALFYVVTGVQLTLLLLAAPAATAGGFCIDKARGSLLQLLVTDLSATEIVLGKLAARLAPVLGLILCSLPVLYIATWFGGIDPEALLGFYLVSLGVAILSCALALTFSVWGKHTHEVLLVIYMLWLVGLLARPIYDRLLLFFFGPTPGWIDYLNPYWMTYAPYWAPGTTSWREPVFFLAGSVTIAGLAVLLAASRLRAVTVRQAGSSSAKRGKWRLPKLPGPPLSWNPVLWREWQRTRLGGWVGAVVLFYALMATLFSVSGIYQALTTPRPGGSILAICVNGLQVAVGMLFLTVSAVTALSEERVRGSLDVLMVTPLSSTQIVLGKWLGSFRHIPYLVILPGAIIVALALLENLWEFPVLLLGYLFAYGAFLTTAGVLIAIVVARLGRAVTVAVILYALMSVFWPILLTLIQRQVNSQEAVGLLMGSPGLGALYLSVAAVERRGVGEANFLWWSILWTAGLWILAFIQLGFALISFDYFLGRVSSPLIPPLQPDWKKGERKEKVVSR